jgi:hypothetical protein
MLLTSKINGFSGYVSNNIRVTLLTLLHQIRLPIAIGMAEKAMLEDREAG